MEKLYYNTQYILKNYHAVLDDILKFANLTANQISTEKDSKLYSYIVTMHKLGHDYEDEFNTYKRFPDKFFVNMRNYINKKLTLIIAKDEDFSYLDYRGRGDLYARYEDDKFELYFFTDEPAGIHDTWKHSKFFLITMSDKLVEMCIPEINFVLSTVFANSELRLSRFAYCEECNNILYKHDLRMRFCSKTCAGRKRLREFRNK